MVYLSANLRTSNEDSPSYIYAISKEAWKQYLSLDEICNELECARYKAMYLAGAADHEKLSK